MTSLRKWAGDAEGGSVYTLILQNPVDTCNMCLQRRSTEQPAAGCTTPPSSAPSPPPTHRSSQNHPSINSFT